MADPYKNNVVLYLPMEGARHGDTVILDKTGKTVTRNGDTILSTTVAPPFGTTSCYFDGTGDYLSLAHTSDFSFITENFTIEAWVSSSTTAPNSKVIIQKAGVYGSLYPHWGISTTGSGTLFCQLGISGVTADRNTITGTTVLQANTWYHIVFERSGSVLKLFVNGVQEGGDVSVTVTPYDTANVATVGIYTGDVSTYFAGYIKDFRITKNIARYTANFYVDQKPFDWDSIEPPRILI